MRVIRARRRARAVLIINCKNYAEASGRRLLSMLRAAASAQRRFGVRVAVAPPPPLAAACARRGARVFAQHVDCAPAGGTTGRAVPEILRACGVSGSLVNHSENRARPSDVACAVEKLRALGMVSVVCARTSAEALRMARLGPDYVAIEPPDLIGSGRAVSSERPALVEGAARAVASARTRSKLLCGAGIASAADARRAGELGSSGVLVASGVVKAASPARAISELAAALAR